MQKGKGKAPPVVPPPIRPREGFLTAEEVALLDAPSSRLYRMILRQPEDYNNWQYSENHNEAFGYEGECNLDLNSIKVILLHDWLDASILKFYCM